MAHQIEMSTAEAPAVNVFRQNVNFFGKSIPLKTNIHIWNCSTKQ